MQNPEAWAEHDVQRLVEEYWRNSCNSDGGQEQGGMVGLAKMIKLVRPQTYSGNHCIANGREQGNHWPVKRTAEQPHASHKSSTAATSASPDLRQRSLAALCGGHVCVHVVSARDVGTCELGFQCAVPQETSCAGGPLPGVQRSVACRRAAGFPEALAA